MLGMFYRQNKKAIFIMIILVAFFQRGSTLVVEFYDVDEITDVIMVSEIVDGGKAYVDAVPGRPFYFAFFYGVFKIFGSGNIIALHFITILWIIGTCYLLYKINTELFNEVAGYLAAFFYAVYVSSFFEYYLAVHGEIIYNLPVALAFYFFVLAHKNKRIKLNYFLAGLVSCIAFLTKGQTLFLFLFFGFYLVIVKTITTKTFWREIINGTLVFSGFIITLVIVSGIFYLLGTFDYAIKNYITKNVGYALLGFQSEELLSVIKKVLAKVGQNAVAQLPLWLLFPYYVYRLNKFSSKDSSRFMLVLFLGFSFVGVFLGGSRLYNHYFLQYLPALCLIAGYSLTLLMKSLLERRSWQWVVNVLLIAPIIFYPIWNYGNAYYSFYQPEKAYPLNHGVIPRKSYKKVSEWIKAHSLPEDRIVQWGECVEIYHFSMRRPGIRFLWSGGYVNMYKSMLLNRDNPINKQYDPEKLLSKKSLPEKKQWTFKTPEDLQYTIILDLDRKKPRYIIDTAPSHFRGFKTPLKELPILFDYVNKYYIFVKVVNKMEIYELKSR